MFGQWLDNEDDIKASGLRGWCVGGCWWGGRRCACIIIMVAIAPTLRPPSLPSQAAMDACPVSCIHWVDRADLPALEFTCQKRMGRPSVAAMMSGQGGVVEDVWSAAANYLKEREKK